MNNNNNLQSLLPAFTYSTNNCTKYYLGRKYKYLCEYGLLAGKRLHRFIILILSSTAIIRIEGLPSFFPS
jgi:hypothetical protein